MPAKDKKYRKTKKWLEELQIDLDKINYQRASDFFTCVRKVFEDTHEYLYLYVGRSYGKKYGRTHNPQDYIDRTKKKKYRAPIRR